MLTPTNEIRQHEELIIERGIHCGQIEAGNPFFTDQDFCFSSDQEGDVQCNFPPQRIDSTQGSDFSFAREFIQESLETSLTRFKRHPNSPHLANTVALDYLRMGEFDDAIEGFQKALKISPDFFSAKANLAKCYTLKGKIDEALAVYKQLEKEQENDATVLTNIAHIYFTQGELDLALSYLTKAKSLDPYNHSVLNNIAIIHLLQKQANKAISSLRAATRLTNEDHSLYNNLGVCFAVQGNIKKAITQFRIAASLNCTDRNTLKNLSNAYQRVDMHKEVISLLEDYMQTHTEDAEFKNIIAWSFFKLGLHQKCMKYLSSALKSIDPSDIKMYGALLNNTGVLNGYLGHLEYAEEFITRSLDVYPKGDLNIHCNIIELYLRNEYLEKAKERIDAAIALYSDEPIFMSYLGEYFCKIEKYDEAKNILFSVVESAPKLLLPYATLSTILVDVDEDPAAAREIIEKGFSYYPTNVPLLNNYAYSLILLEKLQEARTVLDKSKIEDNVHILATRGLLLIKEGNVAEGRRYYNQAISLAGKKSNLAKLANQKKYLELGKYYLEEGDTKKAARLLKKGAAIKTKEKYYKKQISRFISQLKST